MQGWARLSFAGPAGSPRRGAAPLRILTSNNRAHFPQPCQPGVASDSGALRPMSAPRPRLVPRLRPSVFPSCNPLAYLPPAFFIQLFRRKTSPLCSSDLMSPRTATWAEPGRGPSFVSYAILDTWPDLSEPQFSRLQNGDPPCFTDLLGVYQEIMCGPAPGPGA